MSADTADEILIRREGRAGRITLNRPKALNALTYPMVQAIWTVLNDWANDPTVALVLVDGAGERGLCAGGDVIALYETRTQGSGFAAKFWRDEYILNAYIGRYPKPYVALMDGIVLGGGIGISSHGSHRIVSERAHLAMPETGIGLIPDVGGTWLLANAPGQTGVYLGLTGARMDAADALYAKFADTFIPLAQRAELIDALVSGTAPVREIVSNAEQAPGPSSLAKHRADIDQAFGHANVEACLAAVSASDADWAKAAAKELSRRSPQALKASFAAIRQAHDLGSLEAALNVEYRLVVRLFENGEFIEGIRALVVDKDRKPKWQPPQLEGVNAGMVEALLAPYSDDRELGLAPPAG